MGNLPEHYGTTSPVHRRELLVYLPPVLRQPHVVTVLRLLSPRYLRLEKLVHVRIVKRYGVRLLHDLLYRCAHTFARPEYSSANPFGKIAKSFHRDFKVKLC